MIQNDTFFMNLLIQEAWKNQGLTYPNPTVASAVVDQNSKLISVASHQKYGEAHAEVLAIRDAYTILTNDKNIQHETDSKKLHSYLNQNHKNIFQNSTIYVTLEPCNHYGKTPPCSLFIQQMGFKKVVIGAEDKNKIASGGADFLQNSNIEIKFCDKFKKEINFLLEPFNLWNSDKFIFFKYASTLNGNLTDGVISNSKSREYVHKLRDKIDLLVIGGNTVRKDRPTLDSRLIKNGKNPDILILSQQSEESFNKNIPLFTVPNRKVFISDSLDILEKYNFIMFEGGENMLNFINNQNQIKIEYFLLFLAPIFNNLNNFKLTQKLDLEFLNIEKLDSDLKIWAKRV
jgi:diaminohydroxyphosphoribosylaminopyrimidine deaminase/5-amino-6-(5-phosphoribosylamino)uracil reductase